MPSPPLKYVFILISGNCDYVTLRGKRDLGDVIQLRMPRWGDYPGSSVLAHCDHKGPSKRQEGNVMMELEVRQGGGGGEDGGTEI